MSTNTAGNDCAICRMLGLPLFLFATFLCGVAACITAGGAGLLAFVSQPGNPLNSMVGGLGPSFLGGSAQIAPIIAILCTAPILLLAPLVIAVILFVRNVFGGLPQLQSLIRAIPLLKSAATGLEEAAAGLFLMETALRDARVPVDLLADAIKTTGDKIDINVPTLTPRFHTFSMLKTEVVVGLDHSDWYPLHDAHAKLEIAAAQLSNNPESLDAKLDTTADNCKTVAEALHAVASIFAQL